jgi:hypothetical protein
MNFKSLRSYWDFRHAIKNNSRFILDQESKDFLTAIEDTCSNRIEIITMNSSLWRAQIGCDYIPQYQEDANGDDIYVDDIPVPFGDERMKPLVNRASEGRANPKGIPYLYVATDKETAMSEVRPSLGTILSVGKFKPIKELKIIDFSVHQGKINFFLKEPNDTKKLEAVWTDMDNAFSIPTSNTNFNSDYVPTQIIAEFIKSLGYDGIAYKSSLGKGHNIVLFDLDIATITENNIYEVEKIDFDFKIVVNQYT